MRVAAPNGTSIATALPATRRTAAGGFALAQTEQRTLVTTDKGFSTHRDDPHHGLLVVRLRQPNEQRIHARVMAAFRQFTETEWPGLLVVMRDAVQSVHRA